MVHWTAVLFGKYLQIQNCLWPSESFPVVSVYKKKISSSKLFKFTEFQNISYCSSGSKALQASPGPSRAPGLCNSNIKLLSILLVMPIAWVLINEILLRTYRISSLANWRSGGLDSDFAGTDYGRQLQVSRSGPSQAAGPVWLDDDPRFTSDPARRCPLLQLVLSSASLSVGVCGVANLGDPSVGSEWR